MQPADIRGKKVLYGCLDWGSGHVARSIPLILQLERQGNTVFFCGSPEQYRILQQYGSAGTFLDLPGTGFRFKGDGDFTREGVRNAWKLYRSVCRDRSMVEAFAKTQSIDVVISDHRYGIRAAGIPAIFVTHQVQLPPGTNRLAQWLHRTWMKPFCETWIMDTQQDRLAGILSEAGANGSYIGHYSRFSGTPHECVPGRIVAVISGPEPYAEQLLRQVLALREEMPGEWLIVTPKMDVPVPEGVRIVSNWQEADAWIASAETIVSRNGYSTLMDLLTLEKKAVLIPTPGQPEQLYLASHNRNPDWRVL